MGYVLPGLAKFAAYASHNRRRMSVLVHPRGQCQAECSSVALPRRAYTELKGLPGRYRRSKLLQRNRLWPRPQAVARTTS